MSDGRIPDDERLDDALGRALRRAAGEARPRAEFRDRLRDDFAEGRLEPEVPVHRFPRWIAYPAAAAILLAALVGIAQMAPREEPAPRQQAEVRPVPPPPPASPEDAAFAAAEGRLAADPVLGGRTWQRRTVEGRPWLLPAEAVSADAGEVAVVSRALAKAERLMAGMLPSVAARPSLPVVAVVAPSRADFEALASPLIAPVPVEETIIAFALPAARVLLVSPETLAPGGPPCEEMDLLHEAGHAWLHARQTGTGSLPTWVDEGLAGLVAMPGPEMREWTRKSLAAVRGAGIDPFEGERLFLVEKYGDAARRAIEMAPCEERPLILLPTFNQHGESLVEFLLDADPGRRAKFEAWLGERLDGKPTTPADTAKALGFESLDALLAARDAWMGL